MDLGLFEPGSLDLGTPAFRGWSGGAASEITVGTGAATPGYWPGPLPAGEWHVLLGLYKVGPARRGRHPHDRDVLRSRSRARAHAGPAAHGPAALGPGLVQRRRAPAHAPQRRRADHGRGVPARPRGRPRLRRDHRPQQHDPPARHAVDVPGLLRIVGEEVTTPGGHASVCGLGGWRDQVDFRVIAGDERIRDLVRAANDRGALFVINHPRAACLGCAWEHNVSAGVAAMEITAATAVERATGHRPLGLAAAAGAPHRGPRVVGLAPARSPDRHRQRARVGGGALRTRRSWTRSAPGTWS